MKKNIILITLFLPLALRASEPLSQEDITAIHKEINNCQIQGLAGTYHSDICRTKISFRRPQRFGRLAKGQNFMILHGTTGNGKTTLVRCLAKEMNAQLVEIVCPTTEDAFVGAGAKNLEEQFKKVEELALNGFKVVILLDEIDTIGAEEKGNPQRYATAETLWHYLDKFNENNNILMIGTTNRYEQLLPQTKSRAGTSVKIDNPSKEERTIILDIYCKSLNVVLTAAQRKKIIDGTDKVGRRAIINIVAKIRQKQNFNENINNSELGTLITAQVDAEKVCNNNPETNTWTTWNTFMFFADKGLNVGFYLLGAYLGAKIGLSDKK